MPRIIEQRDAIDIRADTGHYEIEIEQIDRDGEEHRVCVSCVDIERFIDGVRAVAAKVIAEQEGEG